MNKKISIIILCFGLAGCMFKTIHPQLSPKIEFHSTPQKMSHNAIEINAVDSRESTIVGPRCKEGMSAPILIEDSLAPMITEKFELMAKHHGYNLEKNEKTHKQISARLLVLSNNITFDTFKSWSKIDVAIEVASKNRNRNYTHIYRDSKKTPIFFCKTESELQENISQSLSDVLSQITNDNNLWNFLSK